MLETHKNLLGYIKGYTSEGKIIPERSVLGMFSGLYVTHYFYDMREISGRMAEFQKKIDYLPKEEQKKILLIVGEFLADAEADAFEEGMRVGVCLVEELKNITSD